MQKRLSDRFTSVELSPSKVLSAGKKTSTLAGKLVLWSAAAVALFPLLFTVTNSFLSPQEVINRYSCLLYTSHNKAVILNRFIGILLCKSRIYIRILFHYRDVIR